MCIFSLSTSHKSDYPLCFFKEYTSYIILISSFCRHATIIKLYSVCTISVIYKERWHRNPSSYNTKMMILNEFPPSKRKVRQCLTLSTLCWMKTGEHFIAFHRSISSSSSCFSSPGVKIKDTVRYQSYLSMVFGWKTN